MIDISYFQNRYTIYDFDFKQKTVMLRVDFNIPISDTGEILDNTRIKESLPTIDFLIDKGSRVILVSHFKRPKEWEKDKTLEPVAKALQNLMKQTVHFIKEPIGTQAFTGQLDATHFGDIVLLENIRFYKEEVDNNKQFSQKLASLCDFYINDAFGTMHRTHASTVGITEFVPSGLGLLPLKELSYIEQLILTAKQPLTVILAGGKTSSKITLLKGLMEYSTNILIGGGMVFTFFKAMGYKIGQSLYEEETLPIAQEILKQAKEKSVNLVFPTDIVCATAIQKGIKTLTVNIKEGIPDNMMGLDIGSESVELFASFIRVSKTIFWNGPVGVFEVPPFDKGTQNIAKAIRERMKLSSEVLSLVGGGESAMAAKLYGIDKDVSHISTGGGALLEFLEGVPLPGIMAIPSK